VQSAGIRVGLPNVYQKKQEALALQGLPAFPFSGCLPEVYQGHFFNGKATFFSYSDPYLQEKPECKGRYTGLNDQNSLPNLEKTGKLVEI